MRIVALEACLLLAMIALYLLRAGHQNSFYLVMLSTLPALPSPPAS